MVIQLLAGMFIGSVVVCLVGGFILKSAKNKADALRRERDEIMRSLGELWVQIDKLISANRGSNFETKSFKDSFKSKIDEVNRLFKPNIHRFDVYYVKYIENLITHYSHSVLKGEVPIDTIAMSSDVELETNYSVVEQVVINKSAGIPVDDAIAPIALDKTAQTGSDVTFGAVEKAAVTTPQNAVTSSTKAPEATPARAGDNQKISTGKDAAVATAPDTDVFEISTADVTPVDIPAAGKAAPLPVIDIPENKQDAEDTFDFEVKKLPEQEITMEVATAKAPAAITPPGKAPVDDEDMAAFEQTVALPPVETESPKHQKAGSSGDEDFTMETLIDVDISTISPFLKKEAAAKTAPAGKKAEEHALFDVSAAKEPLREDAANLEIVIASNASHSESAKKGAPASGAKAADAASIAGAKDSSEKEVDFEAFFEKAPQASGTAPKSAVPAAPTGVSDADIERFDKDEESITGDDVANKIAALESAGTSVPVKDTVSKDVGSKKDKPVAAVKPPVSKSPVLTPDKKGAPAGLKAKSKDDSITGDDVAEKIDAFFGLLDDKK